MELILFFDRRQVDLVVPKRDETTEQVMACNTLAINISKSTFLIMCEGEEAVKGVLSR